MDTKHFGNDNSSFINCYDSHSLRRMSNIFSFSLVLEGAAAFIAVYSSLFLGLLIQANISHRSLLLEFKEIITMFTGYNNYPLFGFLMLVVYFAYMFIPFAFMAILLKENPFKSIPFKFKNKNLLFPLLIIGLAASIIGELYADIFSLVLAQFNLEVNLDAFNIPNNVLSLVIYILNVSIFAPICEEFVFRGLILQNLRKYGTFFALIVSSMMFGILHGNFVQTPFAFVVGLALGLIVIETNSLFSSMILHCLINSVSTIFSILSAYANDRLANSIYIIYGVLIAVLTVLSIIYLFKKTDFFKNIKERYFDKNILTNTAFVTYVKTPGFIIFLFLFFISMFLVLKIIG